ncbi:MAG: hypothetical protein M1825_006497 [Sarcosagium campestre]|nr:MAG: hypothetical protein M1825_006497 [Sarcosagium campestre]
MNLSAILSIPKVIRTPSLCLPHANVSTFAELPIPLTAGLLPKHADIKAVVLDKDDCFALPRHNEVYKPFQDTFDRLRTAYPGRRMLIVSNSSGTNDDRNYAEAKELERNTGVTVLRHLTKKPGALTSIFEYFAQHPELRDIRPANIAVIGDRLLTDVVMANMMGAWAIWVRDGVRGAEQPGLRVSAALEHRLAAFLVRRGYEAPVPD